MGEALRTTWSTPEEHLLGLHPPGSAGYVTLVRKQGEEWHQHSYPVNDLAYGVKELGSLEDIHVSQNRFWVPRRKVVYLSQLDAMWTDIDFYRVPDLAGRRAGHILDMALMELEEARIPSPSVAISSGRGLLLLWLHQPVPRKAIPRWNACQRTIYQTLKHLGADAGARDAARTFRLIGSVNSKNGAMVEALTPTQAPWDFDTLAEEILPLSRAELLDLRAQREARRAKQEVKAPVRSPNGFTAASLWENRLTALQMLREMRYAGPLPPGHRDYWLYVATVAATWISIPQVLMREAHALAQDAGGWSQAEARSRMSTIISNALVAAKGRVGANGNVIDPRYKMTDETIIELLGITPDEQRQLPCLWGPDVGREKDRERKIRERREVGVVTRDEYLAQAALRRVEAHKLRERGFSIRQIAAELGCSPSEVSRLIS